MKQRSRQSKALTLAAGKIGCFFLQHGIQPVFAFQKFCKLHLFQYTPKRILVSVQLRHPQILPDSAFQQIALMEM